MAASQWALQIASIETERLRGRLANIGDPDDEEVRMEEDKVIGPTVTAGIKETNRSTTDPGRYLAALQRVAERARPDVVVQMVGALPRTVWDERTEAAQLEVSPQSWWNEMINME